MDYSSSALVPRCRRVFSSYLESFGYSLESGTDMEFWCDEIRRHSEFVNPQFMPENLDQSASRYVSIRKDTGELACTIAFRFFETDDFLDDFEEGRFFYDRPEEHDWRHHQSGLRGKVDLSGNICSRGGLHSYDRGNRISWPIPMRSRPVPRRLSVTRCRRSRRPSLPPAFMDIVIRSWRSRMLSRSPRERCRLLWSGSLEMKCGKRCVCALNSLNRLRGTTCAPRSTASTAF